MSYASGTDVPAERSRAEIDRLVRVHGADTFGVMDDGHRAQVVFRMKNRTVRISIPLPRADDKRFTQVKIGEWGYTRTRAKEAAQRLWAQEMRRVWRALLLVCKAKFEAIESGISTFDDEFMAHIVLADGRTIGEVIGAQITNGVLALPSPEDA